MREFIEDYGYEPKHLEVMKAGEKMGVMYLINTAGKSDVYPRTKLFANIPNAEEKNRILYEVTSDIHM